MEKQSYTKQQKEFSLNLFRQNSIEELSLLERAGVKRGIFDDARKLVLAFESQEKVPNIKGIN